VTPHLVALLHRARERLSADGHDSLPLRARQPRKVRRERRTRTPRAKRG